MPMALMLCTLGLSLRASAGETRTLSIYNIHTKETVAITYKVDGEFVPDGLKQVNHVMRDWRRDEPTEMDPELVDLIWELHRELGSKKPVHLISGFRSRATNDKLRRSRGGQARNSRHILGKAADIHFPDVSVKTLRNSALVREVGGVGYYPTSALPFVHVDTGHVRHWPRLPRQELAALFPLGKTGHRPRDGKPITLADARRAQKSGKYPGPPPVMVAAVETTPEKPETTRPAVVTASLAPSISDLARAAASITGTISRPISKPATPAPDRNPQAALQLASATPDAISRLLGRTAPLPDRMPRLSKAIVASAPDFDPEHPEELSYQPFSILPFMRETPVSHDQNMVGLALPGFKEADYLLVEPDRGLDLRMKPQTGIQRIAAVWEFTGPAVTNLLAGSPAAPRTTPGRIMTASSPAAAPSLAPPAIPAPGGFSPGPGGAATGLGFQ